MASFAVQTAQAAEESGGLKNAMRRRALNSSTCLWASWMVECSLSKRRPMASRTASSACSLRSRWRNSPLSSLAVRFAAATAVAATQALDSSSDSKQCFKRISHTSNVCNCSA